MKNKLLFLLVLLSSFATYSQQWTDITASIGAGISSTTNMSKPYIFDLNNDNYPDFLAPVLSSVTSPYTKYWRLYKNNGNSTFNDVTSSYGLPTNLTSTLGFIDFNGDGFKDLYFYSTTGLQIFKNNNGISFTDVSTQLGISSAFFTSGEITSYPLRVFDYDLDGDEDLLYTRTVSGVNTLTAIVNNGSSFSTKVNILNSIPGGGMNFSFFDMDNDGDFDIVFDAYSSTSQYSNGIITLYRKDATGYTNTTSASGLANGLPGEISTIDINQDGNLDIVKGGADCCTSPLYRVFIGNGAGVFSEQTTSYAISNGGYKYNATLTDFDNDTDFDFSWSNYTGTGAAPFRLYVNNGSNVFTENATTYGLNLGVTSGGVPIDDFGNGVWMDIDKDGDLDIILNREGQGSTSTTGNVWVKRNPLQGNYINIKLNGCGVNKSGIGAKIKLVVGTKTKWLYYEKSPDGNITNGTDTFHFGLGSATLINSITVYWPNNTITVLNNVSGNQFLTIGGGVGSSSAPTGSTSQTLCSGSTIANLTSAIGTNIQWYATSTGGTALASTTALINGTTYYASQTVNSCESTSRLAVIISLNNPSVTASATSVCAGQSTTLTASSGNPTTTNYSVGSIGPSGGYVFYDQGSVINGWRYLEAAPSNIQNSSWGCGDVNISGATSLAIGSGLTNTNAIVNTCTASTIAAKRCLDYSLNGYDDWYLPSQNEFSQIYQNLILNNLGNFNVGAIPTKGTLYWTSSQLTAASGSHFCLECGGNFYQYSKIYELYVRPIRQFSSGTPFSSYLWSTGETTPTINPSPNQNTQYWVDVTTNGVTCRKYITITVDSTTSAPTGSTSQTICSGSTIANLTATGTNIKWYSTSKGGTALASTIALVNGTTYYASQTVDGCESTTRLAVTLSLNNPSVTASATTVCAGQTTTLTASSGASAISNFSIGSVGPAGGYVFYDQGSEINGWRYLEVSSQDYGTTAIWGCEGTNVPGTSSSIGTGLNNTKLIIQYCNDTSIAAKLCSDAIINRFDDWYLPSKDEFYYIYQNLNSLKAGNFVNNNGNQWNRYWTSTQISTYAYAQDYTPYYQQITQKVNANKVRPIRQFSTGAPFSSYLWSTGETTPSINPSPYQNTQYWVDVTTNGITCRKYITVTVDSSPKAPTGSSSQTLCSSSTVANLTATGTNIQWYSGSTGGTALASTNALVNGTTYYASQTVNNCGSTTRLAIGVSLNNPVISSTASSVYLGDSVSLTASDLNNYQQINNQVAEFSNYSSNMIGISYNSQLIPTSNFSYDFWFNTNRTITLLSEKTGGVSVQAVNGQNFVVIPDFYNSPYYRGTGISVGTNGISVIEHCGNFFDARLTYSSTLIGWHHCAVVYQNNGFTLFLDGNLVGSRSNGNNFGGFGTQYSTMGLVQTIGKGYPEYDANDNYTGKLDEYRQWSTALSSTQISQIYNRKLQSINMAECNLNLTFDQSKIDNSSSINSELSLSNPTLPSFSFDNSFQVGGFKGTSIFNISNTNLIGTDLSTYVWSTGQTSQTIDVIPPQTSQYWVDVTTNGITCRKYNTITVGSLDTEAFDKSSVSLYPNPTSSLLNVKVDTNIANEHYTISDALGKIVLKGKLNEGATSISVEQLSKGIYFIKLSDNNASKFIKE